jgi:hypothetical protein
MKFSRVIALLALMALPTMVVPAGNRSHLVRSVGARAREASDTDANTDCQEGNQGDIDHNDGRTAQGQEICARSGAAPTRTHSGDVDHQINWSTQIGVQ